MSACSICFTKEATHAFRCRDALHLCVCQDCGPLLDKCPICRNLGRAFKVVQCSDVPAEEFVVKEESISHDSYLKNIFDKAPKTEQNMKNLMAAIKTLREYKLKPYQEGKRLYPNDFIRVIIRKKNGTLQLSSIRKFISMENGKVFHDKGESDVKEVFGKWN